MLKGLFVTMAVFQLSALANTLGHGVQPRQDRASGKWYFDIVGFQLTGTAVTSSVIESLEAPQEPSFFGDKFVLAGTAEKRSLFYHRQGNNRLYILASGQAPKPLSNPSHLMSQWQPTSIAAADNQGRIYRIDDQGGEQKVRSSGARGRFLQLGVGPGDQFLLLLKDGLITIYPFPSALAAPKGAKWGMSFLPLHLITGLQSPSHNATAFLQGQKGHWFVIADYTNLSQMFLVFHENNQNHPLIPFQNRVLPLAVDPKTDEIMVKVGSRILRVDPSGKQERLADFDFNTDHVLPGNAWLNLLAEPMPVPLLDITLIEPRKNLDISTAEQFLATLRFYLESSSPADLSKHLPLNSSVLTRLLAKHLPLEAALERLDDKSLSPFGLLRDGPKRLKLGVEKELSVKDLSDLAHEVERSFGCAPILATGSKSFPVP